MTLVAKRLAVCLALVLTALAPVGAAAQSAEPTAWDGQRLSNQSADVQAMFTSVWGDKAAAQWAKERSTALLKAQSAAHGVPVTATSIIPDAPPITADTTVVPLTWTTSNAPVTGDLIDVDQGRHLLYVGHGATDSIEVYDVASATPKWVRSFHVPGGAAGILIATDIQKVFGGTPNGMVIVDADPNSPTYGTTLNTIYLGKGGTDELDYDPVTKKVYVTDVGDHAVASVDAVHNTLIKMFPDLPESQIEQPRYNPSDGFIYMSWRATNKIAKFDPRTDTLVSVTDVGVPCTPSGFAIKPATNLAMLVCRAVPGPGTVFWNLTTNTLDHTVSSVTGGDGGIYNAKMDRFFAATSRWHRGPVMAMFDGSGNFITNVPTTTQSHQVGFDETNRVVYALGGGLVSFTVPF
jgi:DNA-binding beta-propeller fold protein YncE